LKLTKCYHEGWWKGKESDFIPCHELLRYAQADIPLSPLRGSLDEFLMQIRNFTGFPKHELRQEAEWCFLVKKRPVLQMENGARN
jgi:hypothetical protein